MMETLHSGPAAISMDGIYRRQRFIYDATRRYYLLGRDRLIADLDVPDGGSVLEIACGTARNLIKAARRYPTARLHGLDISAAMLQTAARSVVRSGCETRIFLNAGDATDFDAAALFGIDSFDRVFISYSLSMIPSWPDVVRRAATCVAPGGTLHVVDFGDFARYPALFRRAQLAWLRRFSVMPIAGFETKIAALADELGFTASTAKLYGGYAVKVRIEHRIQRCPPSSPRTQRSGDPGSTMPPATAAPR
jgi:S-adenosylmethionine-diacylgycerolhomoserine-N-methlytransferase